MKQLIASSASRASRAGIWVPLLSLTFIFMLSGCASKEPIVKTEYISKEPLNLSIKDAGPLKLNYVTWKVIIVNGKPFYALTSKGYEDMSINMKEISNYIEKSNTIIQKYQEYYEKPEGESR